MGPYVMFFEIGLFFIIMAFAVWDLRKTDKLLKEAQKDQAHTDRSSSATDMIETKTAPEKPAASAQ